MKKILFGLIISSLSLAGISQVYHGHEASQIIGSASKIRLDETSSTFRYVEFSQDKMSAVANDEKALKSIFSMPEESGLQKRSVFHDQSGFTHTRYQLTYRNIPVEGGMLIVHEKNKLVFSANGDLFRFSALNTLPELSADEATMLARKHINAKSYFTGHAGNPIEKTQLVILPLEGSFFLSYKTDIYAQEPFGRNFVYVDALTGTILKVINRIHENSFIGTAETKYHGTQAIQTGSDSSAYILNDNSRGVRISTLDLNNSMNYASAVDFTDTDNYWNQTANQDDAATSAHFAVQKTFDYFLLNHGRNSFDDDGAPIVSYIHFGSSYVNAFWNGYSFSYGDGDGSSYSALTSLDVVAHEYTHAVTQYTAGLEYAFEPGALNESFSDIFGVVVDFFTQPAEANYTLGERTSLSGNAFRNMADPKQYSDPDTYKGQYWISGSEDNGGVHTNSGVQNYWFYILSEGGNGVNDRGDSYRVEGIGIEKAAAIAYRNLSVYLTPYSRFEDARFYSIQSAADLYGACSPEVKAVTNAWHAVGVGGRFTDDVMAGFSVSSNFSCSLPATIKFTNLSLNAGSYAWDFGDGSFSSGLNPEHTYGAEGNYTVRLIAEGLNDCMGTDSLEIPNLINIRQNESPAEPSCLPEVNFTDAAGIYEFKLNTIHNYSSPASDEGAYVDYSCSFSTDLTAGEIVNVGVLTGSTVKENVALWIDLNNDGDFSSAEKIWESNNTLRNHAAELIVPEPLVYNHYLRLRVGSARYDCQLTDACGPIQSGQFEDYRVRILENHEAVIASFTVSDTLAGTGDTLILTDRSQNLPSEWYWEMPGAIPAFSTERFPEVVYHQPGEYTITLKVKNEYGSDSIVKENFVKVLPGTMLCQAGSTELKSGLLYDSGGEGGNYGLNEKCSFLIQPACAQSVQLTFLNFALENRCDYLYIYDGTDAGGRLLLAATGDVLPAGLIASSGSVFLSFSSNGSITGEGFKIRWEAVVPPEIPVMADFSVSADAPAFLEKVVFTDLSTQMPVEWLWDFGDGFFSTEQNPQHAFASSGEKQVTLIASNCFYTDTLTRLLTVMPAPSIEANPGAFSEYLQPGHSGSYPLIIRNSGTEGPAFFDILIEEATGQLSLEKSRVYESEGRISKQDDTLTNASAGSLQSVSFGVGGEEKIAATDFYQPELEKVLDFFAEKQTILTQQIPDCFYFTDGTEGNMITDGGNDMFDGGNFLSAGAGNTIQYSNNLIRPDAAFGNSGRYFTSKQPGIFMLAADIERLTRFSVAGNLGADGAGMVDAAVIRMEKGIQSYTGFVKRVYGTGDPSVNHLIIIPNAGSEVTHSIDINSNSDGHVAENLENAGRLYYFLFSSANGGYISDSVMISLMSSFIGMIEPGCSWLKAESFVSAINPGVSEEIWLTASALEMASGIYRAEIRILSNDTAQKGLVLPFMLQIDEPCRAEYTVPEYIGQTVIGTTLTDSSWIRNEGPGVLRIADIYIEGEDFDVSLGSRNVETGDSTLLMISYSPERAGQDSAFLIIRSNAKNLTLSACRIYGEGTLPPVPFVISQPGDMTLTLGGEHAAITLDTVFSDPGGSVLQYDVFQSGDNILAVTLDGSNLMLAQEETGETTVDVLAYNSWGESARITFRVLVVSGPDNAQSYSENDLTIYPNPAVDLINILIPEGVARNLQVMITGLSGQIVWSERYTVSESDESISCDISSLIPGIYSLSLNDQGRILTDRLVRN